MEAIVRRWHVSLVLGGLFVLVTLLSACGGDGVEAPVPETVPIPEETVPET